MLIFLTKTDLENSKRIWEISQENKNKNKTLYEKLNVRWIVDNDLDDLD